MKLSVLMPVYNECATLREILKRVEAVPIDKEIVLVDNCSTDGTRELLQEMLVHGEAVPGEGAPEADEASHSETALRVILQERNKGKGSSVRRALAAARGEWIIVQDADLEYDPQDYLRLLAAAQKWEGVAGTHRTRCRRIWNAFVAWLSGAAQPVTGRVSGGAHRSVRCFSSALRHVAFGCGDVLQVDASPRGAKP
jgi:glycosyltransferase involved in cell wall biosynthesis